MISAIKIIPFLFPQIVSGGVSLKDINEPQVTEQLPAPQDDKPTSKDKLNLGNLFGGIKDKLKLRDLTDKEKEACNVGKGFLKHHTPRGKISYAEVPLLVEGLKNDSETINKEGEKMGGFRGMAARNYPNNLFRSSYYKVQEEVARRAYPEITKGLKRLGVDPSTAHERDNTPPNHYEYVTKPRLLEFQRSMVILELMSYEVLPKNMELIFPKRFGIEDIEHVESRKIGVPPNGKLVEINPNKDLNDTIRPLTNRELQETECGEYGTGLNFVRREGGTFYYSVGLEGNRALIYKPKNITSDHTSVQIRVRYDDGKLGWAQVSDYPEHHCNFIRLNRLENYKNTKAKNF